MNQYTSPEKIWSLSRRTRSCFCPRSAVLRYREAPGALQESASEFHRRLYSCSKRISDSKFIRETILHTMQSQFYTGECDAAALFPAVMENFAAEYRRMLFGQSRCQLYSLCGSDFDCEAKEYELRREISAILHKIRDAWQSLLQNPPEARRTIAKILDLHINDWRCLGSPLCAFHREGKLCFVEFRSGEFSGAEGATAAIHRFYALNHCGRTPQNVESWLLDYHRGELYRFAGDTDASDAISDLNSELEQWEKWWSTAWEKIPGNRENCLRCVFKNICSGN